MRKLVLNIFQIKFILQNCVKKSFLFLLLLLFSFVKALFNLHSYEMYTYQFRDFQ